MYVFVKGGICACWNMCLSSVFVAAKELDTSWAVKALVRFTSILAYV